MNNSDKKKIVLFDFDGVIVNTFDMCFEVGQYILPGIDKEKYRAMFDGNIYSALENYDGVVNRNDKEYFIKYTGELMKVSPVDGIEIELKKMSVKYSLAIVTSTMGASAKGYLEKHGLDSYFESINGFERGASKIEKITSVLETYSLKPADAVFIQTHWVICERLSTLAFLALE